MTISESIVEEIWRNPLQIYVRAMPAKPATTKPTSHSRRLVLLSHHSLTAQQVYGGYTPYTCSRAERSL